jgi:pleiotropic regulator 1
MFVSHFQVISGHYGWVRCLTVEPENQWFATGAADRLIKASVTEKSQKMIRPCLSVCLSVFVCFISLCFFKIWDLASGELKLTLTGHISAVRGLEVSTRHPYLFSASEDKTVKCWDLEYNKVRTEYFIPAEI